METALKSPVKTTLKRRLNDTELYTRTGTQEDASKVPVTEVEDTAQFEDSASQVGSFVTPLDMPSTISISKLQIKSGLEAFNVSINARNKRRDELLTSIARKKEELRENNERTAELRRKNEEISLMIQAEDNDAKAFYDNLKQEMEDLQFFETQVLSTREQIQMSKLEANRNKIKQAENMKRLAKGEKTLALQEETVLKELEEQERKCLALQEMAKAMGDPAEVCAELLRTREHFASLCAKNEQKKETQSSLAEQLEKAKERRNQAKAKHEELKQQQRLANETFQGRVKNHEAVMERLRNTLEARRREKEYKEQMLNLEKEHLARMTQSLTGHESDRDAMRSSLDQTMEQYEKLKEDVARLNLREQELERDTANEAEALNQAKSTLHTRQLSLEQKQRELEESIRNLATLQETLEEKNARREKLKIAILEKQIAAERALEVTLEQMDLEYKRDLAAMDEEFAKTTLELERKIEAAQTKMSKLQEDYEVLVLNHATSTDQLNAEQTLLSQKLNATLNQIKEFEQNRDLLEEKLELNIEEHRIALDIKRTELEEMKKEMEREEERRRKELEEVNAKKSQAEAERAVREEKCNALLKQKEEAAIKMKQMVDQIEQHKAREVQQEEKIAQLQRQIEEGVMEENNARAQMEVLRSEISQTQAQIANVQASIEQTNRDNDAATEVIQQEQAKLDQLEEEKKLVEAEHEALVQKFEQMKMRHAQESRDRTSAQERKLNECLSKKEAERAKFRVQYEKLHTMYENVSKANKDAADELTALRAEREKRVQSLHALMKEKETLDGEYKKYREKILRMQKMLITMEKASNSK